MNLWVDDEQDFEPAIPPPKRSKKTSKKEKPPLCKPDLFLQRYKICNGRSEQVSRTCYAAWEQIEKRENSLDCLIMVKPSKDKYKKIRAENRYLPVHAMAYFTFNPNEDPEGKDVSHLCHCRECINPRHLILETQAENLDRNRCIGTKWMKCPRHPEEEPWNPCSHLPQCILPNPFVSIH